MAKRSEVARSFAVLPPARACLSNSRVELARSERDGLLEDCKVISTDGLLRRSTRLEVKSFGYVWRDRTIWVQEHEPVLPGDL